MVGAAGAQHIGQQHIGNTLVSHVIGRGFESRRAGRWGFIVVDDMGGVCIFGGTSQLNPVPAEGREGDLAYPDELWRRLRRRV